MNIILYMIESPISIVPQSIEIDGMTVAKIEDMTDMKAQLDFEPLRPYIGKELKIVYKNENGEVTHEYKVLLLDIVKYGEINQLQFQEIIPGV